jgi:hypothetical protein
VTAATPPSLSLPSQKEPLEKRPRQDDYLPLPLRDWEADDSRGEWMLIVLLLLLGHAVEPLLQAHVERCVQPHGAHRTPGVKNAQRMRNKLYGDYRQDALHSGARPPLSSLNVDINRCACTFETHALLADAFHKLQGAVGRAVRVKNSFSPAFDAPKLTFGYRCILMNLLFCPTTDDLRRFDNGDGEQLHDSSGGDGSGSSSVCTRVHAAVELRRSGSSEVQHEHAAVDTQSLPPPPPLPTAAATPASTPLTWGDLVDRPATLQRWASFLANLEAGGRELYDEAMALIETSLRDVPVQWVCEVQLLLSPYVRRPC